MSDDDRRISIALGVCGAGLFMIGLALLWAVASSLPQLLSWWVAFTLQLLLLVVALGVAIALPAWLIKVSTTALVKRLARLEREHAEILHALRKRAPTFLATAVLAGQVVLLLADSSFEGDTLKTLMVSVALLLGLWVANELQAVDSTRLRTLGWLIWLGALAILPIVIMISRNWGIRDFGHFLLTLDLATQAFAGIAALVLVCAPLCVSALAKRAG